ncbi:FAD binding domain-containing protein [Apiospora marii]|uniref:FAD binding domain-containing protein n=1 Tax=Apiospora marii TaxID=335849 RepID=A0ABR1RLG0_9PEZI
MLRAAVYILAEVVIVFTVASAVSPATLCCDTLSRNPVLQDKVLYPNSSAYDDRIKDYFAANAALKPWCMALPLTSEDASESMRAITANNCPFGIRGGGHMVFAGSSSTDHGVTIDLGYMNHTTYDPNTKLASVRPGGTWAEVYRTLVPHGVTVTGARSNVVGVGGFLLGGGNSLHAAAYGWACQNVENFEVVLANGSVVDVNRHSHSDLWLALRGGSANFGLVTRFDMRTIPEPLTWGGGRFWTYNMSDAVLEVMVKFTDAIEDHVDCSVESMFGWDPTNTQQPGGMYAVASLDNVRNEAFPEGLRDFLAIEGAYDDFLESRTVLGRTTLGNGVDGLQAVWVTGTYNNDIRILRYGLKRFEQLPLTVPMIRNGDGPNVLGLRNYFEKAGKNSTGMLSVVLLQVAEPAHLAALERIGQAFQRDMDEHATELGINWGWKYLNYADYSEDPIAGYGEESVEFLREVSRRYDPDGIFQYLRNTGFKLAA